VESNEIVEPGTVKIGDTAVESEEKLPDKVESTEILVECPSVIHYLDHSTGLLCTSYMEDKIVDAVCMERELAESLLRE